MAPPIKPNPKHPVMLKTVRTRLFNEFNKHIISIQGMLGAEPVPSDHPKRKSHTPLVILNGSISEIRQSCRELREVLNKISRLS